MSVLDQLASALQRKDELPNQELAARIAAEHNTAAVQELIGNLNHKNKGIQSDCIKVLYETGERQPQLIAPYIDVFAGLLNHNNNRLQWGAMTALDAIATVAPDAVYALLPAIIAAADKGSVITKDHGVAILIQLCTHSPAAGNAFDLLLEQLLKAAPNQLPMYAENALPLISSSNKAAFIRVLHTRLPDIEKESKVKRVTKVLAKAQQR